MSILLREQEQVIALKTESAYGTDATPTGANALLVHDISITALDGDVSKLNNLVGFLGNQGSVRINSYCRVDFKVYLVGAGTGNVDVPPHYAALYDIASHADVVTADTSVDYTLVDTDVDSGSLYYLAKEHLHAILGVRGSVKWMFSTTGLPYLQFTGMGLYVEPVKQGGGLSGVNFAAVPKPLKWTKQTVPVLTLHGEALDGESLEIDQGQPVEYHGLIQTEEVLHGSRNATLKVTIREPDIASKNWFAAAEQNAFGGFALQHGVDVTHEGRIFEFAAPRAQLTNCERSFIKGAAHLTLTADLVATAPGNDYSFASR